ncbi:unnamed protein product [Mytilus edulis]|uniref:Uncharacterized protein n=1 Tax=Mytilus edulis TaxID=6550 RepID=A0A8S3SZY0_MYTED|nr:unnamed protein product [Mytilus edulis]
MEKMVWFLVVIICHVYICSANNQTEDQYQTKRQLKRTLMEKYSNQQIPRKHEYDGVYVAVNPYIDLFLDFNENAGTYVVYALFRINWEDDYITWNETENDGITFLRFPVTEVWFPKIMIRNTIEKRTIFTSDDDLDQMTTYVEYYSDGSATVLAGGVIEVVCHASMYYFPFDSHVCNIELYFDDSAVYTDYNSYGDQSLLSLTHYTPHAEWDLTNVTSVPGPNGWPQLIVQLKLERKPLFVCVSLILPIFLVSFVNVFVFVLPIESGERISLSVTLFLTFVVIITMVSENLPESSEVSIFIILLITKVISSILTTVMAIVTLSLYYRNNDTKTFSILKMCTCATKCRQQENSHENQATKTSKHSTLGVKTNWQNVVQKIDRFCIFVLVVEILSEIVAALIIFRNRWGLNNS